MTPEPIPTNELLRTRRDQMFPKLTAAQIARLEHHGERRQTKGGEILYQPGDRPSKFFVVISGDIELYVSQRGGFELFYTLLPGDFTGSSRVTMQ